jgi:SecD/SecF fusion protein
MEKPKRWQFYVIVAVIVLTLINILPTVFFYTKPLKDPVSKPMAESVALDIVKRVDSLEEDSKAWLLSFSKLLKVNPVSINLKNDDPGTFEVTFNNPADANLFKRFLFRAGSLIPFVPAQLEPSQGMPEDQKTVLVARQINVHLDPAEANRYFHYYMKEADGALTTDYRESIYDRTAQLALGFGGGSKTGQQLKAVVENPTDNRFSDLAIVLSKEIVDVYDTFGKDSPITKRYLGSLAQVDAQNKDNLLQKFVEKINSLKSGLEVQKKPIEEEKKKLQAEKKFLDNSSEQRLAYLDNQFQALNKAAEIIKDNNSVIQNGKKPFTLKEIKQQLQKGTADKNSPQTFSLEGRNPYIESLVIDWNNDKILVKFYEDIQAMRNSQGGTEEAANLREKVNQNIISDIARVSRIADESIGPDGTEFAVTTTKLTNAKTFLSFDLGYLSEQQSKQIVLHLLSAWVPEHSDLDRASYPIIGFDVYKTLSSPEQKLGLVVYAPAMYEEEPPAGFRKTSLYVIARGLDAIVQKYRETPNAPGAESLSQDLEQLTKLLKNKGFIAYSGSSYGIDKEFSQDYIFELDDYYTTLLNATREDFYVKGSKRNATLDFTDVEQRIIALNTIEDHIQEDLLKWKDEYNAAQVDIDVTKKYDVPPPTKNVYWENFKLSLAKYFRGDDRKILKWGLDLSGGKTVRIGLRDQNNHVVTNPDDIKTVVNELYTRINKMGVAERTIRIENDNIILDFPGSQALSASDLVKASAMYFHIVNEKFSLLNTNLQEPVNQFLQNVWNEAVVTNRKDVESINEIAWTHLGGSEQSEELAPRNESAKILYENGLRLARPDQSKSPAFDDTFSSIAVMRGEDFSEWDGQSHPLVIVFHNYALEGASLTDVNVGYDPSEGNNLHFSIKRSYENTQKGSGSPRDDFYAWTSQFSEDKIAGTPKEGYSQGHGWRMAVILNNTIITKPQLRAALRDAATISGRFTQREITQLAADLKAGSLSFTPKIMSEQNVSPELGQEERTKGIYSSFIGLLLVAGTMIVYYRFGGLVATFAVLLNLLIMWGVLQNMGAALTLPGIAGIVLTIGMAVDANVLVFERVREEFKISGRIASAIQAGYRKAFSAIVDSNVTTLIAAFILIQFDSGPIKGFAVTLMIGLISSMFTALFMTRFFFAWWVQNSKNKRLTMMELVSNTNINFLKFTKPAIIISIIIVMLGGFFFYQQRNTIFGMDFTGGYSLNVEVEEIPGNPNYRSMAEAALLQHGASPTDFEIRQLTKPTHLRIQLSLGMEQSGHPFHQLPLSTEGDELLYEYQKNPRTAWVVNALTASGFTLSKTELSTINNDWSMMSGQFSDKMRNNAIIALCCALISILIYITFRFEFKYAISAVLATGHDVFITLGILGILRKIGLPIQIDLEVVGAIMTLIGYSLNDTIIIFDRIREELKIYRKMQFHEVINHAINDTLARTIMTSSTVLMSLIPLVFLGGHSIFDFSLVMLIGVIVGTFSSHFIAAPLLLYFHNREVNGQEVTFKRA